MGKEQNLSVQDIHRLLDLVIKASEARSTSPSEVIDNLWELLFPGDSGSARLNGFTAELVNRIRHIRMRRNQLVGAALFRDPAWDMLLELYSAHHRSRPVSVKALCYSSGVPFTTALRQVARLEALGLVRREGDPGDNRFCWILPTPKALEVVTSITAMLVDNFLALHSECISPS